MKFYSKSLLVLPLAVSAWAQPSIMQNGVVNAASYTAPQLPGGNIAQGSMFIVFGNNLGPANLVQATSYPLPTSQGLSGTSVKVGAVDAIMVYASATQVAAILPSTAPAGAAQLTVTYNGQTSAAAPVNVVRSSFGAFTLNQAGTGPGIIQNYVSASSQPVNTITGAATPGQVAILWGTGLGPASGDEAAAPPVPTDLRGSIPVEVWVGNQRAEVLYAGRTTYSGIDQINFRVPSTGVAGCYVTVAVKAGAVVSNVVSVAVAPGGTVCSDANGFRAEDLAKAQSAGSLKIGSISLERSGLALRVGAGGATITINATSDLGAAAFGTYSTNDIVRTRGVTEAPSVGSCAVSPFTGIDPSPVDPVKPTLLNAGNAITVTRTGAAAKSMDRDSSGAYSGVLGGVSLDDLLNPGGGAPPAPYLSPGAYTVSGPGGSDVGSFSANITIPQLTWTNMDQITSVPVSQDLTVTWSGGDPQGFATITGISSAVPEGQRATQNTPGVAFLCVERASAQRFVVPSVILQTLPLTPANSQVPTSFLLVGSSSASVPFTAQGLDVGYLTYRSLGGKNITFGR